MAESRILITGADGFIGSHLTETLVRQGRKVRAFCLYNSFGTRGHLDRLAPEIQAEVEFFQGDIRDSGSARAAVSGCDTVLHLAASSPFPIPMRHPTAMWRPMSAARSTC